MFDILEIKQSLDNDIILQENTEIDIVKLHSRRSGHCISLHSWGTNTIGFDELNDINHSMAVASSKIIGFWEGLRILANGLISERFSNQKR